MLAHSSVSSVTADSSWKSNCPKWGPTKQGQSSFVMLVARQTLCKGETRLGYSLAIDIVLTLACGLLEYLLTAWA